ncbi:MAG TPA: hypothetical protein VJK48_00750 [Chlamydiales bacterium]|nr:hypothetical protein [Chlamydiales bacterium]
MILFYTFQITSQTFSFYNTKYFFQEGRAATSHNYSFPPERNTKLRIAVQHETAPINPII